MGICCVATLLLTSISSIYAYTISRDLTHAIGVLFVAYYLTNFLFFILKSIAVYKILPNQNLKKKYGSWAVITGCTDGIGEAFAKELSNSYGLNIVLISRTQSKLDALAKELPTETVTIAADLSSTENDIYQKIKTKIVDPGLDVGILINNVGAGYDHPDYFQNISYADIDRMISIDCFPQAKMTHMLLPLMKSKKAGLVISLSSFSAVYPMPLLAVYSACKEFNRYLSESLRRESQHVTFQTIMPYFVTTKLSKIRKASFLIPNTKNFVAAALKTGGHYNVTAGYFPQHLYAGAVEFLQGLPIVGQLIENITFGHLASTMKRAYKKKASQKASE